MESPKTTVHAWFRGAHGVPLVIAHRGCSRAAPGNSLDAFEAAVSAGADAVEFDVRQTADGHLVVHHNPLRRGTQVSRLPLGELRRRCRHQPPTLEEVVERLVGRVGLDVELKEPGYEAAALEVIGSPVRGDGVFITSFHQATIAAVKALRGDIPAGLLVGARALGRGRRASASLPLDLGRHCGADFIVPHQLWVALRPHSRRRGLEESPLLAAAATEGVPVIVWTVNGAARLRRYLGDRRITAIITDLPALAVQLRGGRPPSSASPPQLPCPHP